MTRARATSNWKNDRVCRYFGTTEGCKYGDKCWFAHAIESSPFTRVSSPQGVSSSQRNPSGASTSATAGAEERRSKTDDNNASTMSEKQTPCRFFLQGHCRNGNLCRRSHDSLEHTTKEAETTIQQIVFEESTLVTCGAGMQVRHLVSGFDCCYITIKNLPQNANRAEVEALFIQRGVSSSRFYVVNMRTLNYKVEAKVFVDANIGDSRLAAVLNGRAFRGEEILDIALDDDWGPSKMASSRSVTVLRVSWKLPSATYLVHCSRTSHTPKIIDVLHGAIRHGQRIQAVAGRPYFRGYDRSVMVSGLPVGSSLDVEENNCCLIMDVTSPTFNAEEVELDLKRAMKEMIGYQTYEVGSTYPNMEAHVQFDSWANAKRAYDRLTQPLNSRYPDFDLQLPPGRFEYTIKIPLSRYRAQEARWNSLCQRPDRAAKAAFLNIEENTNHAVTLVRVHGEDKKEVGQLKVRVENLAAGETLDASLWHRSFMSASGRRMLNEIGNRSKAYIRCDWKTKSLKLYANRRTKGNALKLLKEKVELLNNSEFSVNLDRDAASFFLRRGVTALKQELGDDAVTLRLTSPARLVVRGGEAAHRIVDQLLEESRMGFQPHTTNEENICPVCFDEPSSPVLLCCKHVYCTECIRHFLFSASERKQFPLVCAGNDDKCKVPIAIPVIQRFLSQQQLDELFEAAATSYIEKHPGRFQYCKTADCKQVYQRGKTARPCPSCLISICTMCYKEEHDDMTCAERELLDNRAEQERRTEQWASTSGAKHCPRCRVFVQKTEGCNHMECRCGVHFCWICLQVFDRQLIYEHMRSEHGGIDTPDVPGADQPQRVNQQIQADCDFARRIQEEARRRHLGMGIRQLQQAFREEEGRVREERGRVEEQRRTREGRRGWCVIM
ncbi:hypothetical protein F5887DRAFT_1282564 [Amanita rubescens]|nr:hypothetical protein F5887DRAFT_1282564 [Amanita rubescens]